MNIEADAYIHPTNGTYYLGLKTYFQKCLFKYANTIDYFLGGQVGGHVDLIH